MTFGQRLMFGGMAIYVTLGLANYYWHFAGFWGGQ